MDKMPKELTSFHRDSVYNVLMSYKNVNLKWDDPDGQRIWDILIEGEYIGTGKVSGQKDAAGKVLEVRVERIHTWKGWALKEFLERPEDDGGFFS